MTWGTKLSDVLDVLKRRAVPEWRLLNWLEGGDWVADWVAYDD